MTLHARLVSSLLLLAISAAPAFAQPPPNPDAQAQLAERQRLQNEIPDTPGTGRYPAIKEIDSGLPGHVVYRPANLDALGDTKLGIYIFGNGGCSDDGASARLHLLEIASHGYLAIAPGGIYNGPGRSERPPRPANENPGAPLAATRAEQLVEAIDWALAEHARAGSRYFGRVDADAIAVSGFSCGGLQALGVAHDPRIATAVIMNSGVLNDGPTRMGGVEATKAVLENLHFPTLYVLGGSSDIAYANGMDDFARINHVPVAVANIDKGHGGTYWEPNGGAAAAIVVDWLEWHLRGDVAASRTFLGDDCGLCVDPDWSLEAKGFEGAGGPAAQSPHPRPTLEADWVFTIEATIGAAIEMGETVDGVRRSIPITGGRFAGPDLRGEVVPGGADYQQTRPDGSTFIRAVYMIRTDDGALINVVNEGLIVPPGVTGNDSLYFRTSPRFTAPLGRYNWLNNGIFVSAIQLARDQPDTVIIDVYRVR